MSLHVRSAAFTTTLPPVEVEGNLRLALMARGRALLMAELLRQWPGLQRSLRDVPLCFPSTLDMIQELLEM